MNISDNQIKNCMEKLTWESLELARAAAAYAVWQYGDSKLKTRPYRCKYCSKYHLGRVHAED